MVSFQSPHNFFGLANLLNPTQQDIFVFLVFVLNFKKNPSKTSGSSSRATYFLRCQFSFRFFVCAGVFGNAPENSIQSRRDDGTRMPSDLASYWAVNSSSCSNLRYRCWSAMLPEMLVSH